MIELELKQQCLPESTHHSRNSDNMLQSAECSLSAKAQKPLTGVLL